MELIISVLIFWQKKSTMKVKMFFFRYLYSLVNFNIFVSMIFFRSLFSSSRDKNTQRRIQKWFRESCEQKGQLFAHFNIKYTSFLR